MKEPVIRRVWLDTIAAAGADSVISNGIWSFNTAMSTTAAMEPIARYLDIYPSSVSSAVTVAGVPQQRTLTVGTATAGATYSVMIQQYNKNTRQTYVRSYFYVATSVDTTTTIAQVFRNYFLADTLFSQSTAAAGGAAVITVVGGAAGGGREKFTMTVTNGTTLMTSASTVTGVYSVGTVPDLVRALVPTGYAGLTYTTWTFTFSKPANENNAIAIAQDYKLVLYLQSTNAGGATTNYAALQASMLKQFAGVDDATGLVVNIEIPAYI